MTSGRRTPSAAAKRALLTGAALLAFWPCLASAQARNLQDQGQVLNPQAQPAAPGPATRAPVVNQDGLAEGELYLEADQLVRDDAHHTATATGSVEVRYEGRTLRADRLVYTEGEHEGEGVIRAFGHVQLINSDGTVEFADQFTLDDKMRAGVALAFSARLQQNIKLAAATAVRRSEDVQELNRAIFTPCNLCTAHGSAKTPTWSISADRVVRDVPKRVIYYRNAVIRVYGVPLLYLPVFWHADPTADRSSGLLAPQIGYSSRRGFSYEQPYLWVISPSADLTLSPQINTNVNPFLNGRYRQEFRNGEFDARFGYTYERNISGNGQKSGDETSRSYILARGAWQLRDDWLAGFTAERTSDKLLFDKYDIGDVFVSRGPYVADDRRLLSQAYAIRQDQQSYFSIAAMDVQGLRPSLTNPSQFENDRTFPVIAPLVEERYQLGDTLFGGRVRLDGSAVVLTRDQSPDFPDQREPGMDSRRVTGEADWRRSFITGAGLRIDPFVDVRVDGYSISDIVTVAGGPVSSKSLARGLGTAGADISYPFFRRFNDATVILEPLAQLAYSPSAGAILLGRDAKGQPVYFNEDSVALDFDETTLFRSNPFPGYDLYENGARLNVGGRATVLWDDGRQASLLVGRSLRDREEDFFSASSGLRTQASDWIVAGDAQPMRGVSLFARARLDSDTLAVRRLEAGANVSFSRWGYGYVRYFDDNESQALGQSKIQNMDLGGELDLTRNWGVTLYGERDLVQKAWVIRDVGVFYKDDCIRVDVIYRKEDTVIGRLAGSNQVSLHLSVPILGNRPIFGR